MAGQLGRISGQLLEATLVRNGIDIYVKNSTYDSNHILHFDVNSGKIGINTDAPVYDFDVRTDVRTDIAQGVDIANIDRVIINPANYFTTQTGPLHLYATDPDPVFFHDRMETDDIFFQDNYISSLNSNVNINFDPNGSGTIELQANTNITGDLALTGNIVMDGDFTGNSRLIIGDEIYDTVRITPQFGQDLVPGDDATWSLGEDTGDSSPRRWHAVWSNDWTNIDSINPQAVNVNDQMYIDGVNNQILSMETNEDILIRPDTGIVYIEGLKFSNYYTLTSTTTTTTAQIDTDIDYPPHDRFYNLIGWSTSVSGVTWTILNVTTDGGTPAKTRFELINENGDVTGWSTTPGVDYEFTNPKAPNYADSTINDSTLNYEAPETRITNLLNTPVTFAATGTGYLKIGDTGAMILPFGNDADRPATPEVGDTRWNQDQDYLECFTGEIESVSTTSPFNDVTGLPDQTITVGSLGTSGDGTGAEFILQIISEVLTVTIDEPGIGYRAGDTITIPGEVFTGGSSPANLITLTVGAQTNDGYTLSTGGGAEVDVPLMEDLADVYALILG